ncbi:hypothetical protein LCGC14_1495430 [marine sediment metagenome]|uniref:N-acetyltransferase domain-containing protein n=1 Tax=marine sediment metagenome TaxID=412755 RepID=A0A0F9J661_9ZZZZ
MHYSEKESRRFGFNIYRDMCDHVDEKAILKTILENDVDIFILRVLSRNEAELSKLDNIGVPYIFGDTLCCYTIDLQKYDHKPLKNDLEFERCIEENKADLISMAEVVFGQYINHYTSNPYLSNETSVESFKQWTSEYVVDEPDADDKVISWLVKRDGKSIGFATCDYNFITGKGEGVLYGVLPDASGNGVYSDIIRFTQKFLKDLGIKDMKVSSQSHNFGVQKVWSREGYFMNKAYTTVHLNAFLSASVTPKEEIDFKVSESMVQSFADLTGDTNRLHMDTEFAKSKGFDGTIVHGLIANTMLSKYFGTVNPGHGTLFLGHSTKYIKPVYLEKPYKLIIGFPVIKSNGFRKSVAKLVDSDGNICAFMYNDLMKRD